MLDEIKENLVNDLGFEAQVGDTGIVDENGNSAEPSPYRKLISILLMSSFKSELFCYVYRWSKQSLDKLDDKWMKKRGLMWSEGYEDRHKTIK